MPGCRECDRASPHPPAPTPILPVILIVGVIGGGAIIGFLKLRKNKPKAASVPDFDDDTDDEDFVEDETEVDNGDE